MLDGGRGAAALGGRESPEPSAAFTGIEQMLAPLAQMGDNGEARSRL